MSEGPISFGRCRALGSEARTDGASEGLISFGGCRALGSEAQTDGRMNFRIEVKGRLGDMGLGSTIRLGKGGSGVRFT